MTAMEQYAQMAASLAQDQMSHQRMQSQDYEHEDSPGAGSKRKSEDGHQTQQRAKRNRYISIACNECKRRKIKCNGQTPCQRCGNLNLECVYAPNCCNGFKDTQEYKEMTGHIASLQEQVNALYHDLSQLRAQLGQGQPGQMPTPQTIHQGQGPIDPSLQSSSYSGQPPSFAGQQSTPTAAMAPSSPVTTRPKANSQSQTTFRGPTSNEFQFGVAKNSLQTMGIGNHTDGAYEASGNAGESTTNPSPNHSPPPRYSNQILQTFHAEKDPIWSITKEEAIRLCRLYEDEMGLMYPVLDINKVIAYVGKLYRFMEAAHRSGLMQQGLAGPDALDDEDTNILKMVLATALTTESYGSSELGQKLFECVQPAVDNLLLGNVGAKGIRLLALTAMFEFQRDNEGSSWRIIGLTARLCIELGLHRHETYDAMTDETERSEAILLFWSIYSLDRRWSFGTGMPFALQDTDIDPMLPKPEDRSPYLSAIVQYSAIGNKVWRAATSTSTGGAAINTEEMSYLDYQVIQWHRNLPPQLHFEHPARPGGSVAPIPPAPTRAANRLRVLLYLRANQMRIQVYRAVLHSATSIMQHREQARTVVDVAKDTIRILTHVHQTTDLYRSQQMLFNSFLTSALAVLFLTVSHTPATFADNVREEFYMALDLVRGFSKGSYVGRRLWKTIRVLKEVGPKLGLAVKETSAGPQAQQAQVAPQGQNQNPVKDDDSSRTAALAMAGLAGHNVDEMALFGNGPAHWSTASGSSTSPEGMANDLTSLFEAAGGLHAMGNGLGGSNGNNGLDLYQGMSDGADGVNGNQFGADEELSNILKELF